MIGYFLSLWILLCRGHEMVAMDTLHFNKYVVTTENSYGVSILMTLNSFSLQQCIYECKSTRDCSYINYLARLHLCHVIMGDHVTVILEKPGYVYGNKSQWEMTDDVRCSSCDWNEKCERNNTTSTCRIKACGNNLNFIGTTIFGNVYTVGSKLRFSCNDGYVNSQPDHSEITCLQDGTWEKQGECVSATCPVATNYQEVILTDSTPFTYWIVTTLYTQQEARELCLLCSGALVEVTTIEKLNFLRNTVNGYSEDFWVDGTNIDAADKSSDDAYRTTSGIVIPNSSPLWAPGSWNRYDFEHCVRMRKVDDYYLNNRECSAQYFVICEQ